MYDQHGGGDEGGAVVSLVTSSASPLYPASSVVDGRSHTFWLTGGLYPQQLVVSFPHATQISAFTITSCDVRRLEIEASTDDDQPLRFRQVAIKEMEAAGNGRLQREPIRLQSPVSARHIRLTIHEGYDHFAAIQSLTVS